MSEGYQIVVCGSVVPDPLQTLEPVSGPSGPALKNEMMLPAVLDPWAWHALFEAADLAKKVADSKVWLVSVGPKAKLQQVMMTVAQKAPFQLVALDGPAGGFTEAADTAESGSEGDGQVPGAPGKRLSLDGGLDRRLPHLAVELGAGLQYRRIVRVLAVGMVLDDTCGLGDNTVEPNSGRNVRLLLEGLECRIVLAVGIVHRVEVDAPPDESRYEKSGSIQPRPSIASMRRPVSSR